MYNSKNSYFRKEIDEYIRDNGWIKTDELGSGVIFDKDYHNKSECNECDYVNQFKNIDIIGNKKLQYKQFLKHHGRRADYIPETIEFNKSEIEKLRNLFNGKIYILKPENGLSRRGITIISNYEQLYNWVINSNEDNWILQDFIINPLLFNNKKFHLRIYSILIRNKETFEAYVYYNGFMYSAKSGYNNNNLLNHDSNLSGEGSPQQVNIFPKDFIKEYGMMKYDIIKPQINKIVKETIEASINDLQCPNTGNPNYHCFKLIGYDMLVDSNFKVHMLEINARLISLKYPPDGYKKMMYNDILNLVVKKSNYNFDKVLNILFEKKYNKNENNNNKEHFGGILSEVISEETQKNLIKTSNLKYYIILLVILLLLSYLMKYLMLFVIILIGIIIYKKYYLKREDFSNNGEDYIPKFIYQIWISENNKPVPDKYNKYIKSVREINNDFNYKLFRKEECENFLRINYPKYYKTYQRLPLLIQKIDFVRYVIGYHYGGFYNDLDIEVYKNYNDLRIYENVFGLDSYIKPKLKESDFKNKNINFLISNYAFGCKKGSKLMKKIVDNIHNNINVIIRNKKNNNNYVYKTTGPIYITKMYYEYIQEYGEKEVMVLKKNRGQLFGDYASHKFDGLWKLNIPKIIIQTYYDKSKIPMKVFDNIKKYAPDYKHIIYDDKECLEFLEQNYNKEIVNKFLSLKKGAHKADLFRYCYLYKYGGIYLDIKTELIIPLIDVVKNKDNQFYSVLSKNNNTIYQGILMSSPNHIIFKRLIEHIVKTPQSYINKDYPIFTREMYNELKKYTKQNILKKGKNNKNIYLLSENCKNQQCYDGKDRYGYCCYVYDINRKVIKTRYSDYPWN